MRIFLALTLVAAVGCSSDDADRGANKDAGHDMTPSAGNGAGHESPPSAGKGAAGETAQTMSKDAGAAMMGAKLTLPQVYPLVRGSTPTALIANPMFQSMASMTSPADAGVGLLPQALGGPISLAVALQDRFYSGGPTEILRIVKDLDDRIAGFDTDPTKHSCLTAAPVERTYTLPAGRTFRVMLQCMQSFGAPGSAGAGWVAFGFSHSPVAAGDDAGAEDADAGVDVERDDFYLIEGQAGGMGGAYRVERTSGNVEAWIAVADSSAPMNSRVIMHLITHKLPLTSELALAGAGVGFCSAHLKTSSDFIFIRGKTNAAPPPGAGMMSADAYCDAARAGCFAVSALDMDLGSDASSCSSIGPGSFEIRSELDASHDPGANVMYDLIYTYFNQPPSGVPAF